MTLYCKATLVGLFTVVLVLFGATGAVSGGGCGQQNQSGCQMHDSGTATQARNGQELSEVIARHSTIGNKMMEDFYDLEYLLVQMIENPGSDDIGTRQQEIRELIVTMRSDLLLYDSLGSVIFSSLGYASRPDAVKKTIPILSTHGEHIH